MCNPSSRCHCPHRPAQRDPARNRAKCSPIVGNVLHVTPRAIGVRDVSHNHRVGRVRDLHDDQLVGHAHQRIFSTGGGCVTPAVIATACAAQLREIQMGMERNAVRLKLRQRGGAAENMPTKANGNGSIVLTISCILMTNPFEGESRTRARQSAGGLVGLADLNAADEECIHQNCTLEWGTAP